MLPVEAGRVACTCRFCTLLSSFEVRLRMTTWRQHGYTAVVVSAQLGTPPRFFTSLGRAVLAADLL